jgi:hypothetical protein
MHRHRFEKAANDDTSTAFVMKKKIELSDKKRWSEPKSKPSFYIFRDAIVMAIYQAFPRSITSHLSKTQSRRAPIFILLLSYCCNWGKVTSTLIAIRWTIEHKNRIFVIVKLVIERHIGENFGLFHEGKILLVRASKVQEGTAPSG